MNDGEAPRVRLGMLVDGGLAPAILAVVERGVQQRPALAGTFAGVIELDMEEGGAPVRIVFGEDQVLAEDGPAAAPDLRIAGTMSDLTSLMVAPLVRGVPSPMRARGRAALGMVALGRVRVTGRLSLMRRFLNLIRI
jgi:ubiquinone biosynthesis protein UbiJ